jgi:hypothetical protein
MYAAFLMSTGHNAEALPIVRTAHQIHPFLSNATALLAYLLITEGQPDSALDLLNQAERGGLHTTLVMPLRAYAFQADGKPYRAAAAWRLLRPHAGQYTWLVDTYRARTWTFAGEPDSARSALQTARAAAPDSAARLLLSRVQTAAATGCYAPSRTALVTDLRDPVNAPTCDPLGSWFDRVGGMQPATISQNAIPPRIPMASTAVEESP